MKDFEIITEFHIELDRDHILSQLDCLPNQPIYDKLVDEYVNIETRVMQTLKPQVFLKSGQVSEELAQIIHGETEVGNQILIVLMTIGETIEELIKEYFDADNYLLGLMINTMADNYLFQMDHRMTDLVNNLCSKRNLGVAKKLEASVNVPMNVQKYILEEITKNEPISIAVTDGFMFTVNKTLGYILILTEDSKAVYTGHDCKSCNRTNCRLRKI